MFEIKSVMYFLFIDACDYMCLPNTVSTSSLISNVPVITLTAWAVASSHSYSVEHFRLISVIFKLLEIVCQCPTLNPVNLILASA